MSFSGGSVSSNLVMIIVLFNQNSMAVNLKQIIFDHLMISVKPFKHNKIWNYCSLTRKISVRLKIEMMLLYITPLSAQISASKFPNFSQIPLKICGVWNNRGVWLKTHSKFENSLKILNTHSNFWWTVPGDRSGCDEQNCRWSRFEVSWC